MYNYDYTQSIRELNTAPSLTIPNQAMSMKEIMSRFVSGQPINASQRPEVWDGEEYYPDPSTMDLAELEQLKEQYREEIKLMEERQKKLGGRQATPTEDLTKDKKISDAINPDPKAKLPAEGAAGGKEEVKDAS